MVWINTRQDCKTEKVHWTDSTVSHSTVVKTTALRETAQPLKAFAGSAKQHCKLKFEAPALRNTEPFVFCRCYVEMCVFYKVIKVLKDNKRGSEREMYMHQQREQEENEKPSQKHCRPSIVNLLTCFSLPPNRCAWPFSLFSVTSGRDPFQHYAFFPAVSIALSSPVTPRLLSEGSASSIYLQRNREEEEKRRDFDFWCSFVERFISKYEAKKWLKTSWNHSDSYTHTHPHTSSSTVELNVPVIFSAPSSNTSTLT